jgi:hypothetical protein
MSNSSIVGDGIWRNNETSLSNLSIQILQLFICASSCACNSRSSQFCNPCVYFWNLKIKLWTYMIYWAFTSKICIMPWFMFSKWFFWSCKRMEQQQLFSIIIFKISMLLVIHISNCQHNLPSLEILFIKIIICYKLI